MGLSSRTLRSLGRYWADRLGVPSSAFEESGVTVGSADEGGIQVFCREDVLVVGAPNALLDTVEARIDAIGSVETGTEEKINEWLARFDVEHVLGPTFYGYADRETFTPIESAARVLTATDTSAYQTFRRRIPDAEWQRGGTEFTPGKTVGLFVDEELVAVAGFDVWDGLIAHLAVVTHPDHRSHGYGQAVVSRATERAFADGVLPQYRTPDAWPSSVALARNLGFHRFTTAYLGVYQQ